MDTTMYCIGITCKHLDWNPKRLIVTFPPLILLRIKLPNVSRRKSVVRVPGPWQKTVASFKFPLAPQGREAGAAQVGLVFSAVSAIGATCTCNRQRRSCTA
jgi:hypothetical protein